MKFAFEFKIDELLIGNGITTVKNNHATMYIEDPNECHPYAKMYLIYRATDTCIEFDLKTLNVGIVICTEYAPLNQHHPFITFRRDPDYSDNYFIRFTLYTEDNCAINDELRDFLDFMCAMAEIFPDEYLLENEVDLDDPEYKYIKDEKVPFKHDMQEIMHIMDSVGRVKAKEISAGKYIESDIPSKSINDLAELMNRPMFTNRDIAQLLAQRNIFNPCGNCADDFWED